MDEPLRIGFLGAGQMAMALAKGIVDGGVATAETMVASDRSKDALAAFAEATGGRTSTDNRETLFTSDVVILAVKPAVASVVLEELSGMWRAKTLVVSIAAGVSIETLQSLLDEGQPVIRVMPNTPALIGRGASAFARGQHATDEHAAAASAILSSVGVVEEVDESLLDAVTGLSGSGPAYAYQMIEALSDGGVRQGLPRPLATKLAAQTLLGAAEMVLQTGRHPGELKDAVTSPGGTTIAGLHALEKGGLRGTLMNAVEAATKRSRQLGRPKRERGDRGYRGGSSD